MRLVTHILVPLALAMPASPVQAQTLAQKQMMARQDADFAASVPDTDKACGITLKASIDWPGFLKGDAGQNSVSAYCAEPLNTLRSMCSDATAKAAIAEKIKTYTCGFGGQGKRHCRSTTAHCGWMWTGTQPITTISSAPGSATICRLRGRFRTQMAR